MKIKTPDHCPALTPGLLPDNTELQSLLQKLAGFGPRFTGNKAHQAYVDFLQQELERLGLEVMRDHRFFTKWEAQRWSLAVEHPDKSRETLPVSYYYPYSGITPPEGVRGELADCGGAPGNFKAAAGKIAIVTARIPALPTLLFLKRNASFQANSRFSRMLVNPALGSFVRSPDLAAAARAGVAGVVCVWENISAENALGQYLPFTKSFQGCPGLWVGSETGKKLKTWARQGLEATLTLVATPEENARTDTLYTILPGQNEKENIIINTHTDGPNVPEENGGLAILALARYFSQIPRSQRKRSLILVLATGHFQLPQLGQGGQATHAWLMAHPELWDGQGGHPKTVAAITAEHLGCLEWVDKPGRHSSYISSGLPENELTYITHDVLAEVYRSALEGRTKTRPVVVHPVNGIYFGEGEPLYKAGIPTLSLVPSPIYLCAASPGGCLDRLDNELLRQQIETLAKAITIIDALPAGTLGKPKTMAFNLAGRLVQWLQKRAESKA